MLDNRNVMDIKNAAILNPTGSGIASRGDAIVIQTTTGSMWGKGNTCSDIILFPQKLEEASVELSLDLLPQFGGEQAGIVLFIDSDNYVKFVREMVGEKQVIVLAKELLGEASPELISPFEASVTNLHLNIEADSITVGWKSDSELEFKEQFVPQIARSEYDITGDLVFVKVSNKSPAGKDDFISANGVWKLVGYSKAGFTFDTSRYLDR